MIALDIILVFWLSRKEMNSTNSLDWVVILLEIVAGGKRREVANFISLKRGT